MDIIPDLNKKPVNEKHIEALCRAFLGSGHGGECIYDGSNPYARVDALKTDDGETFVPTAKEIREAFERFRDKGWFGTYDSDVGYYAVYDDEPMLGEFQQRFTRFLFRPF